MRANGAPLETGALGGQKPSATYRLQFNQSFTLAQAAEVASYLRELGISDCYASPLFTAAPESTHGYDVCSFERINPCLGGRAAFDSFTARLSELGLGLLLDVVPNHMGNDLSNGWWADVLENGRESPFATFFDIDWQPARSAWRDQVLLPILEDRYRVVLEAGKLQLAFNDGRFFLRYYDKDLPIAPHSLAPVLQSAAQELAQAGAPADISKSLKSFIDDLPEIQSPSHPQTARLNSSAERLRRIVRASPQLATALEAACRQFNGSSGDPASFESLHRLIEQQHYRLAYWRTGPEEMNYRRFFDISQLVALRMGRREVFDACHKLVFGMVHAGQITGLRVDHPDGLWDPRQYFCRLQDQAKPQGSLYIVAEKILSAGETLPHDWPIAGTTGYDFLNQLNGIFIQSANEACFNQLYRAFTGCERDFQQIAYLGKKHVLETSFPGDLDALTSRLHGLAAVSRGGNDLTWRELRASLLEVIACFPIYRTYLTPQHSEPASSERTFIEQAVAQANQRMAPRYRPALEFIHDLLLLRFCPDRHAQARSQAIDFVMCFQQLTSPVMAKGVEDTAFYRYFRLVSLNEVGADPGRFGVSLSEFHQHNQDKAQHWPNSLLATATHDTKRGEDVRARINVLSEIPDSWGSAVRHWSQLNSAKKSNLNGVPAPDPNDEYLFYQTLVGSWPFWQSPPPSNSDSATVELETYRDRLGAYMLKAIKEAKTQTSWTDPNLQYEQAVTAFVHQVLDPGSSRSFLDHFAAFHRPIAFFGLFNSLSQVLLKITSPGVPDFYQGTELWDLNLVDPDNRRPVDYTLRRQLLRELNNTFAAPDSGFASRLQTLLQDAPSGRIKLYVISRALAFRRRSQELFGHGAYHPLEVIGSKHEHVCAFVRTLGERAVVVAVPRWVASLIGGTLTPPLGQSVWHDTALQLPSPALAATYHNVLTHEEVHPIQTGDQLTLPLAAIFRTFPVALLERVA